MEEKQKKYAVKIQKELKKSVQYRVSFEQNLNDSHQKDDTKNINKCRNWNENQLYKFAAFFHHNKEKLMNCDRRKQWKIFKIMSEYIETRNSNQCRTYTNKMLKSFGNIKSIIKFLKESLPLYHQFIQKSKNQIKQLMFPLPAVANQRKNNNQSEIRSSNHDQLSQNQQSELKQKQELKPTDSDYKKQIKQNDDLSNSKSGCKSLRKSIGSFDSDHEQQIANISSHSKQKLHPFGKNLIIGDSKMKENPKDVQWIECHKAYEAWATFHNNLIVKIKIKHQQ